MTHGELNKSKFFGSAITNLGSNKMITTTSKILTASIIHGAVITSGRIELDGFGKFLVCVFAILWNLFLRCRVLFSLFYLFFYLVIVVVCYKKWRNSLFNTRSFLDDSWAAWWIVLFSRWQLLTLMRVCDGLRWERVVWRSGGRVLIHSNIPTVERKRPSVTSHFLKHT